MRVLVTGAAGMLGGELLRSPPRDVSAVGTDLVAREGVAAGEVDLADPRAVLELWQRHGPFAGVIHGAAWTAVDLAESRADDARRANVEATAVLATACAREGAHLVAVGTDFVFDGAQGSPYREDDEPRPLSVYGRTKLEAERAALELHPGATAIVRTQWLYGPHGNHFPRTIAKLAREKGELVVVDDQIGSPTTTLELAPALWDVLGARATGIYHAACEGTASWYGFTLAILAGIGLGSVRVTPCTSERFPRPAARPAFSALDCSRLTALRGRPLARWRSALADYLARETP